MIEYNFTGGSYRAFVKTTYRNGNSQEASVNSNKFPFIALSHEYVIFDSANHYINPLFATLSGRSESDFWKYQDDCSLLVRDTSSTHQCNFYYNVKLKRGNATKIGIKCKEQVKWASYYDSDVRFYRTPPSAYGWDQDVLVNEVFGIGWSNGGHSYPAGIDTLTGMTVERDLISLVGNNEFYLGFYQNDSKFVIDKLWFDGEIEIVSATRSAVRSVAPLRSTPAVSSIVNYDFSPGTYRAFVRTSYEDGFMQSHSADSNKVTFEATKIMPTILWDIDRGIKHSMCSDFVSVKENYDAYLWEFQDTYRLIGSGSNTPPGAGNTSITFQKGIKRKTATKMYLEIQCSRSYTLQWANSAMQLANTKSVNGRLPSGYLRVNFVSGNSGGVTDNYTHTTPYYTLPKMLIEIDISSVGADTMWYLAFWKCNEYTEITKCYFNAPVEIES